MLYTFGNNEQLTWAKVNAAITHLDGQVSLEDQEKIIRVVMFVPWVRAAGFGNHDFIAIETGNRCGLPWLRSARQHGFTVDRIHSVALSG